MYVPFDDNVIAYGHLTTLELYPAISQEQASFIHIPRNQLKPSPDFLLFCLHFKQKNLPLFDFICGEHQDFLKIRSAFLASH